MKTGVQVALLAGLVLCGAACHAPPGRGAAPAGGLVVPAGASRFQLDSGRSEVLVLVYGAGPLARLGHNHAIAIADLQGELWIAQELRRSVFSLQFPVAAMRLDAPALRAQQGIGFQEALTGEDIDATRMHMLDAALLDAQHYPTIALRCEGIEPAGPAWVAHTAVQVRAYTGHIDVPVKLEQAGGQIVLSGEFTVSHGQLGLTPHTALLGALRVADEMRVRFRLVWYRSTGLNGG